MLKIALTGNIASGKSLAQKIFEEQGIKTIDADKICHDLIENDTDVKSKIFKTFEKFDILDENGEISRKKLGEIVFNNEFLRKSLEGILHPLVKKRVEEFFEGNTKEKLVLAVIPLLYEAKMEDAFDYVILVSARQETRLQRLTARNKFSKPHALKVIESQLPEEAKLQQADFLLENNDTPKAFAEKVKECLQCIALLE